MCGKRCLNHTKALFKALVPPNFPSVFDTTPSIFSRTLLPLQDNYLTFGELPFRRLTGSIRNNERDKRQNGHKTISSSLYQTASSDQFSPYARIGWEQIWLRSRESSYLLKRNDLNHLTLTTAMQLPSLDSQMT